MEQTLEIQRNGGGQEGFTLVETSIALVVIMIGALGIVAVLCYSIKNNTGSRERVASLAVAQQQMERLRNLPFDDAGLTATTTNPATATVTSAERTYAVQTIITNTTSTVKTIQIQVTPQLVNEPWAKTSVTIVAQRSSFALGPYSGGP